MFEYLVVKSFNWSEIKDRKDSLKAQNKKFQIWKDKENKWCIKWWLQ